MRQNRGIREEAACGIINTTQQAKESLRAWSQALDMAIDSASRSRQLLNLKRRVYRGTSCRGRFPPNGGTMKRALLAAVIFLASTSVTSAHAAVACFDWDCSIGDGLCYFNASCSSASPYIWKYNFAFGDGTGTGETGTTTHYHQYASGTWQASVTLSIYYFSSPWKNTVTCWIPIRPIPVGPQPPPGGRCTQ